MDLKVPEVKTINLCSLPFEQDKWILFQGLISGQSRPARQCFDRISLGGEKKDDKMGSEKKVIYMEVIKLR